MNIDWMRKIKNHYPRFRFMEQPVQIELFGKKHVCVSDGSLFVAVESQNEFIEDKEGAEVTKKIIEQMFKLPLKTILLPQLKKWCGEPVYDEFCPKCDGEGCPVCDFAGGKFPELRPGRLMGVTINRNLLARGLIGLDGRLIDIYAASTLYEVTPLFLKGPKWLVAIMPIAIKDCVLEFITGE